MLHRDISLNNIMWFTRESEIVGVLCDWDLAADHSNGDRRAVDVGPSDAAAPFGEGEGKTTSLRWNERIDSKTSNPPEGVQGTAATSEAQVQPRFRTGTGPFMAVDLLISNPPPLHKYRHDLESFLYIYVCAAATFDPTRKQTIVVVEEWNSHDLHSIGLSKSQFLTRTDAYDAILKAPHADFKVMLDGPLGDLYDMFSAVEHQMSVVHQVLRQIRREGSDPVKTKAKVDEIQKHRDALATYEIFMENLREPVY